MHPPDQTSIFDYPLLVDHVIELKAIIERALYRLATLETIDRQAAAFETNILLNSLRIAADELRRVTGEDVAPPF